MQTEPFAVASRRSYQACDTRRPALARRPTGGSLNEPTRMAQSIPKRSPARYKVSCLPTRPRIVLTCSRSAIRVGVQADRQAGLAQLAHRAHRFAAADIAQRAPPAKRPNIGRRLCGLAGCDGSQMVSTADVTANGIASTGVIFSLTLSVIFLRCVATAGSHE